jgi:hypothetical protein
MLGQKLITATNGFVPVGIVASETFTDTADRTSYTFNGTLDAAPNEVVVGLMAIHSGSGTSREPTTGSVGGNSFTLSVQKSGFSRKVGAGFGYKFGPINNPVSQINTIVQTDTRLVVSREAASTHVILSGVKNVPQGSEYQSAFDSRAQTAPFNFTGIADSIVLAIAVQTGPGDITWSGATPLASRVYGDASMSVAYVVGDGSNVSFSATTTGGDKDFCAIAATFAP